ncbi:hypothetical protein CLV68_1499 [Actinokineospora cianjurensis]|uniref:Uncharacterized protein n=1 Tax=Actinokineospora cianjurensis TaxID=585224 RepID=A0A421B9E1_9PSEU|nr:hypothetical protein CLV68_1499 [Actinokineospora cianjurensis]
MAFTTTRLLTVGFFVVESSMSVWWVAVAVPALSGLVWRWVELRFLRRVYERGGAKDLKVAAEALRRTRSWTVGERLARRRAEIPRDSERRDE